ncbi:MAG: protein kinase [Planctomycetota bacterium]
MSVITPGSEVLGWKVTESLGGPVPRFGATKGPRKGSVTVLAFKGPNGALHQALAEGLRRVKDVAHEGIVPFEVEIGDRAVVLIQPDVVALPDEPLDPKAACEALRDLAQALVAYHTKGLPHGELDAWSVALDGGKRLLQPPYQRVAAPALRRLGLLVDPRYAAPEVLDGRPATLAADMFSLGLLLCRLVTGKPPVDATEPSEVLAARGTEPAPALPKGTSPGILALYAKLTSLRPEARPRDAAELLADLEALLTKGRAPTPNPLPKADFEPARVGGALVVAVILALVAGGLAAFAQRLAPRSPLDDYAYVYKPGAAPVGSGSKTSAPGTPERKSE